MRWFVVATFIFCLGFPQVSYAQQLLESYQAYLSPGDHYNSRGVRLRSAAAIIRQDRANFHKFGKGDAADDWDNFFGSKANRAGLERMLNNGSISRRARNQIINGEPVIIVNIYGRGSTATYIEVLLQ